MTDYYAKSEKRARLILCRLLNKPFPDYAKKKSRYHINLPEENRKFIQKFDNELAARGLTDSTRIHYLRMLESFCSHCPKPFSNVTKEDTMAFISFFKNDYISKNYHKKVSLATLRHYRTSMKNFFVKFYEGKRVKRDNRGVPLLVSWIRREQSEDIRKLPKDMLSTEEVRKMVEASPNPRDKAMISVLYESACRAGEFLDMTVGDVKLDQYGATLIVSGKTGDRRIRLIDSVPDLQVWMNCHPLRDNKKAPLWTAIGIRARRDYETEGADRSLTYYSKPLMIKGLQYRLERIADWAGIKKRVYPHLFRHSRITELAKKGFREAELKIIAGWTELSKSPATYIHLSGADVEDKLLKLGGVLKDEEMKPDENLKPRKCPRCKEKNPATAKFCYKCSMVLDLDTAMELEEYRDKDDKAVRAMNERMVKLQQNMTELFEEMNRMRGQKIATT